MNKIREQNGSIGRSKTLPIWKRKKDLLNWLGDKYTTKVIDGENCVYRDLGDYDIEISGGRHGGRFYIYVWKKDPLQIMERRMDVPSENPAYVRMILDELAARYGNGSNVTAQ